MVPERVSQQGFFGTSALLLAVSMVLTTAWCESMSAMGGMTMPGGWTMSMAWMRMPGQTWLDAAASFLGMWIVMMVAMMLPSLVPTLWRCRQAAGVSGAGHLNWLTLELALGYFFIWALLGIVIFPLGVGVAGVEMQQPALARLVPLARAVVIVVAGALQFSRWKVRQLACCHGSLMQGGTLLTHAGSALREGLRLGVNCSCACAGLTGILLAMGVMDLRAMALVTAAITAERLGLNGERVARAVGVVIVVAGIFQMVRAVGEFAM